MLSIVEVWLVDGLVSLNASFPSPNMEDKAIKEQKDSCHFGNKNL